MGGLSAPSDVAKNATGIESVGSQRIAGVETVYTIDGKRLDKMQRGLNIVRMSDGSIKKLIY
jgi:hypothetical protein